MDYKSINYKDDRVIIEGVKNFNVKQTLECGQCFRWEKIGEMNYVLVAFERVIEILQEDDKVTIFNTSEEDFKNIWFNYFDLSSNYDEVKNELKFDPILKEGMEFGYGIRILNQEAYEIIISFIISARNSIPMIKKTILNISEKWGNLIEYKDKIYYTFPKVSVLKDKTEMELKEIGGSFRSRYIVDTSKKIFEDSENLDGKFNIERIVSLNDDDCHKALQEFSGIGEKVADCIMLFSMGKKSAFPVDRWIQRAMMHFYEAGDMSLKKMRVFAREKFGKNSGMAQQYLFYYAKEKGITL